MSIEKDQIRAMLVTGVMLGIFMLAFWLPNHLHVSRLEAQLKAADDSLSVDSHSPQGLAVRMQQVADLRTLTQQSQKYVPQTDEVASLLRQLSIELDRQHVVGQELQTGNIIQGEAYGVIPITLRFKGSFPAVYGFLQGIESMRRMIRITKLDFDGDAQRAEEPLAVRIELYTFFSNPQGVQR